MPVHWSRKMNRTRSTRTRGNSKCATAHKTFSNVSFLSMDQWFAFKWRPRVRMQTCIVSVFTNRWTSAYGVWSVIHLPTFTSDTNNNYHFIIYLLSSARGTSVCDEHTLAHWSIELPSKITNTYTSLATTAMAPDVPSSQQPDAERRTEHETRVPSTETVDELRLDARVAVPDVIFAVGHELRHEQWATWPNATNFAARLYQWPNTLTTHRKAINSNAGRVQLCSQRN